MNSLHPIDVLFRRVVFKQQELVAYRIPVDFKFLDPERSIFQNVSYPTVITYLIPCT